MCFARDLGLACIVLENDCKIVIDGLVSHCSDNSYLNSLLFDFLNLRSSFDSTSFSHVKHTGDSVAHSLAGLTQFYCCFSCGLVARYYPCILLSSFFYYFVFLENGDSYFILVLQYSWHTGFDIKKNKFQCKLIIGK